MTASNALGGLMIAVVIRYADNIVKTYGQRYMGYFWGLKKNGIFNFTCYIFHNCNDYFNNILKIIYKTIFMPKYFLSLNFYFRKMKNIIEKNGIFIFNFINQYFSNCHAFFTNIRKIVYKNNFFCLFAVWPSSARPSARGCSSTTCRAASSSWARASSSSPSTSTTRTTPLLLWAAVAAAAPQKQLALWHLESAKKTTMKRRRRSQKAAANIEVLPETEEKGKTRNKKAYYYSYLHQQQKIMRMMVLNADNHIFCNCR